MSTNALTSSHYATLSPSERKEAFAREIDLSVEHVWRAAQIFRAMEEARDDVSHVSLSMQGTLRRIAAQSLLPEIYVNYTGRLRQNLTKLPIDEQRKYTDPSATVPVLLTKDALDPMQKQLQHLEPTEVQQIFGDGHIRDEEEQRMWLVRLEQKSAAPKAEKKAVIVPAKDGATINGLWVSKQELLKLLGEI